ncbi:class I lanthipeptide [Chitinophaga flava]|uniref:class I lanthipeptide n=1 Tax=Chitinophaga flava TaxID=2259036 RepID=UPI001293F8EC|nr:class I lanthipeptide [Chitinophaga flava]
MKKKKVDLSKKLFLKKEAIVELNTQQQSQIAGGIPLTRYSTCCVQTIEVSCPVVMC